MGLAVLSVPLGPQHGNGAKKAFDRAVEACALRVDIDSLEHGEQTLLGERGVNLSGGQKARVGLARCVYASEVSLSAPLALLDDPLAAVDPSVGKHLLDACVFGALKKCGVVLATHSRQVLHRADAVLVLDSSGTALGFSRWHNLPDEALALVRVDDEDQRRRRRRRVVGLRRPQARHVAQVEGAARLELPRLLADRRAVVVLDAQPAAHVEALLHARVAPRLLLVRRRLLLQPYPRRSG